MDSPDRDHSKEDMKLCLFGHLMSGGVLSEELIQAAEEKMLTEHDQVSCPVKHTFAPGIYVREVTLPAGTLAVGHWQNFPHLNVFVKGKLLMVDEHGTVRTLQAPMTFMGKPGRKVGYILEEVVWQNIYATDCRDVGVLESALITKSPIWSKIAQSQSEADKLAIADYSTVLSEFGIVPEVVRAQSEDTSDQIDFPPGTYKVAVFKSPIEGFGLMATADIGVNELIAPARLAGKRTPAGRFTNHSNNPNAQMIFDDVGDAYLVATREIRGNAGGLHGEEVLIDYRNTLKLIQK